MDESKEKPVDKILQNHDEQNLESDLKNLTLKKSAPISTENKMENVMELHDVQNLESDMEESTLAMRTKMIIVYGKFDVNFTDSQKKSCLCLSSYEHWFV